MFRDFSRGWKKADWSVVSCDSIAGLVQTEPSVTERSRERARRRTNRRVEPIWIILLDVPKRDQSGLLLLSPVFFSSTPSISFQRVNCNLGLSNGLIAAAPIGFFHSWCFREHENQHWRFISGRVLLAPHSSDYFGTFCPFQLPKWPNSTLYQSSYTFFPFK